MNEKKEVLEMAGRNPLRQMYPGSPHSFEDWRKQFQQSENFDEMMGLLHGLHDPNTRYELCDEAVLFLLELADGHNSLDFETLGNVRRNVHTGQDSLEKRRKKLAQKAFQVLCLSFFKAGNEQHYSPYWGDLLTNEKLFEKVMWFLRPSPRYSSRCNYEYEEKPTHPYNIFMEFLQEFVKFGWDFNGQARRHIDRWYGEGREQSRQRFENVRPQLIDIMNELRQLMWLVKQDLDDTCLEKLREISLDEENYYLPNENGSSSRGRKPTTLEEAVWSGSRAAYVLVLHKIRQDQQRVFDQQAEEAHRRYEEKQRKDALTQLAQQQEALARKAAELAKANE